MYIYIYICIDIHVCLCVYNTQVNKQIKQTKHTFIIYIYIHTYIYIYMCVCVHIHTLGRTDRQTDRHTCLPACLPACLPTYLPTYIHTYTTCVQISAYVYVYKRVGVSAYLCTAQTYVQIWIRQIKPSKIWQPLWALLQLFRVHGFKGCTVWGMSRIVTLGEED